MATDVDTNVVQVNATLAKMDEAMRGKALETAVHAGALPIQVLAKEIVHKISGDLSRSIHTEVESDGKSASGRVGTDVEYALAEEFRAGGGHAYMRPAFDGGKEDALKEVAAVLKILVRQSIK